jgi:hypothetical protein
MRGVNPNLSGHFLVVVVLEADFAVCFISRYPFGIFYVAESNRIVVHAILDLRRDPEKI